jgi:hypothetical protein
VDETVEKLKGILQAKEATLFALVDHSGEADDDTTPLKLTHRGFTGAAPDAVDGIYGPAVERMPAVVDGENSSAMGTMNGRWFWAAAIGCLRAGCAIGRLCSADATS